MLFVLAFIGTALGVWLILAAQPFWGALLVAFQIGFVITIAKRMGNRDTARTSPSDLDPTP